jgi:tetratricopeptide (TPR) repeat protein
MKKLFDCLAVLMLGLMLSGIFSARASAQGEVNQAEKAYNDGQEAFYTGLYEEAIKCFQKAVSLAPEEAGYGVALGKAYFAGGKVDEAQGEFEGILKEHATNVEAGKELAGIYAQRQEWQKVFDLQSGLLPYKHDYDMFKFLADAAQHLGKTSEAKRYYIEALKFNGESSFDHYQLGDIYLTESKFLLAAEEYSRALELGLEDALIHYKLGTAYYNLRNYLGQVEVRDIPDGIVEEISDDYFLIEALPDAPHTFNCAPVNSAVYQVKKALQMGIAVPEARLLFANVYFNTHRLTRAIELLLGMEKDIKEEDKPLFYDHLGQAYFLTGRYDEFLAAVKKSTAKDAEAQKQALEEAYHSIAQRYEQVGDAVSQINYLLKCVKGAPTNAQYHLELGDAYFRQNDYAKAATHWGMTLDLQPDHPERMRITNLMNQLKAEGKL